MRKLLAYAVLFCGLVVGFGLFIAIICVAYLFWGGIAAVLAFIGLVAVLTHGITAFFAGEAADDHMSGAVEGAYRG